MRPNQEARARRGKGRRLKQALGRTRSRSARELIKPSQVLTRINPTAARSNKSSRLLVRLPLPVIPSLASRPNPVPPATATPSPVTSHDPRASPSPAPPGSDRGAGPRGGACPDGRDNRRGAGSGGVSQDKQTAREILEVVVTEVRSEPDEEIKLSEPAGRSQRENCRGGSKRGRGRICFWPRAYARGRGGLWPRRRHARPEPRRGPKQKRAR